MDILFHLTALDVRILTHFKFYISYHTLHVHHTHSAGKSLQANTRTFISDIAFSAVNERYFGRRPGEGHNESQDR